MSQPVLFIGGNDAAIGISRVNRETPPKFEKRNAGCSECLSGDR